VVERAGQVLRIYAARRCAGRQRAQSTRSVWC
jgi:hypothetical protein